MRYRFLFLCMLISASMVHASTLITMDRNVIDAQRPFVTIELVYNYEVYTRPFFFKPKSRPCYGIWARERLSGELYPIFVTRKAGLNQWFLVKRRPEAIPIWYGVQTSEQADPGFDINAVSGATPQGDNVTIYWQIPDSLRDRQVDLFIEANNAFDFNAFYNRDKAGPGFSAANGQPSVVWKATLEFNHQPDSSIRPLLIGHGDPLGKTHAIDPDVSHITTAAKTFKQIRISYHNAK
jgi:hypothetical protein